MERERRLVRLGWCLLLLGWISLFRLVPECLMLRKSRDVKDAYLLIVLLDYLTGWATLFASSGLLHRRPWGPRLAVSSGATAVACSLVWGIPTAAFLFSTWSAGTLVRHDLALFIRLATYVLAIAIWPWAFRVLLDRPSLSEERWGRLSLWLLGSLGLGTAVSLGIWQIQ